MTTEEMLEDLAQGLVLVQTEDADPREIKDVDALLDSGKVKLLEHWHVSTEHECRIRRVIAVIGNVH